MQHCLVTVLEGVDGRVDSFFVGGMAPAQLWVWKLVQVKLVQTFGSGVCCKPACSCTPTYAVACVGIIAGFISLEMFSYTKASTEKLSVHGRF